MVLFQSPDNVDGGIGWVDPYGNSKELAPGLPNIRYQGSVNDIDVRGMFESNQKLTEGLGNYSPQSSSERSLSSGTMGSSAGYRSVSRSPQNAPGQNNTVPQYAPGTIEQRNDGFVLHGFENLPPEKKTPMMKEYVATLKKAYGFEIRLNKHTDEFQMAFWVEAQKQGVYVTDFEPSAEQKRAAGFDADYRQPGTIENSGSGVVLYGFEQLPLERKEPVMKSYVSKLKEASGNYFSIGEASDKYKFAFWIECQRQGVAVTDFNPMPGDIYPQGNSWTLCAFSLVEPHRQKEVMGKYVSLLKNAVGSEIPANSGDEKFRLAFWEEAQKQNVFVSDFNPTPEQKQAMGLAPDYKQIGEITEDSDGLRVSRVGEVPSDRKTKVFSSLIDRFKRRCPDRDFIIMSGDVESKLAAWAEAQRQNVFLQNFEPTPEQKKALGFDPNYRQPGTVEVTKENQVIWHYQKLSPARRQAAMKKFVSEYKKIERHFIEPDAKESEEFKLDCWAEAQRQKVYVFGIKPTASQKVALGFDADYRQPGTVENFILYGYDDIPSSRQTLHMKAYVMELKKSFGNVISIKYGTPTFKAALLAEAQDQRVAIMDFGPRVFVTEGRIYCPAFDRLDKYEKTSAVQEYLRVAKEVLKRDDVPLVPKNGDDFNKAVTKAARKVRRPVTQLSVLSGE